MKLNRLFAFVASALLVAGTIGIATQRVYAQSPSVTGQQGGGSANRPGSLTGLLNAQDGDNEESQGDERKGPESGSEEGGVSSDLKDKAPTGNPGITEDSAKAAALAYMKAARVNGIFLDDENGHFVYSVEVGGADVKVDAMSGAVINPQVGEE